MTEETAAVGGCRGQRLRDCQQPKSICKLNVEYEKHSFNILIQASNNPSAIAAHDTSPNAVEAIFCTNLGSLV